MRYSLIDRPELVNLTTGVDKYTKSVMESEKNNRIILRSAQRLVLLKLHVWASGVLESALFRNST